MTTRPGDLSLLQDPVAQQLLQSTDVVTGIAPEYATMSLRCFGEEAGRTWLEQLAPICPQMTRIFVQPAWVGIIDFETRFPSAVERAMQRAQA